MNPAQRIILILICGAAATCGFLVGKRPGSASQAADSKSSVEHQRDKSARSHAEISAQLKLSELPASIATVVEIAAGQLATDSLAALTSLNSIEDDEERSAAFFALIGVMDASQLGAMMTVFGSMTTDETEEQPFFAEPIGMIALCDRWVHLDPDAAIAYALSPSNLSSDPMETSVILRVIPLAFLAQRGHPEAFAAIEQLGEMLASVDDSDSDSDLATMLNVIVGSGIAVSDPVISLRTMVERGIEPETLAGVDGIFDASGPFASQMLAEVVKLPEGEGRTQMLATIYGKWARYDQALAFASLADLPDGDDKSGFLYVAIRGALESDPRGAAQYLDLISDPVWRLRLTRSIANEWAETDAGEALEWASGRLPEEYLIELLNRGSFQLPPDEAKAAIAAWSDQTRQAYFAETGGPGGPDHFVRRMMREGPRGTIAWLKENDALRNLSGPEIASVVMEGGLEPAIQFAAMLPDGPQRHRYLHSVAVEIGRSGKTELLGLIAAEGEAAHASAVASWAREAPTSAASYASGHSTELLGAAIRDWTLEDPGAAFHWLVESQSNDPQAVEQVLLQSELASRWTQREPALAAAAIAQLPLEIAGAHLGTVIKNWAHSEPATASEYVAENFRENGPLRDRAIASLVDVIGRNSPVEAQAWAESIGDEVKRAEALQRLDDQK